MPTVDRPSWSLAAFGRAVLRWTSILILVGALLLAAVFAYLWTGLPATEGSLGVAGLSAPARIFRDDDGVVTIRAQNRADAAFALGFAHAQDRMWQMEVNRRVGAGRLSEAFGPATVPFDRFMRVLGLYRLAEQNLQHLDADMRTTLDAYAAGVNAWIGRTADATLTAWPPEFYAARVRPAPWRPADSMVWGRTMALLLSGFWRRDLMRARVRDRLGDDALAVLWPPSDGPLPLAPLAKLPDALAERLARAMPDELTSYSASNQWVVDGSRTVSGKPILANDPHLALSAPGTWYLVRIETPDGVVAGASAPGVPLVVLGHNGRIAWGFTTPGSDTQDLVVQPLDPADPQRYLTSDGSQPFADRLERIDVRGHAPLELNVRETHNGPVISDVAADVETLSDESVVVALSWTALRPDDRTPQAVHQLSVADGWDGFLAAMNDFHSPQQNTVFAAADGDIGFFAPGRLPRRTDGAGEGRLPVNGGDGELWAGDLSYALLPRLHNPPSGAIVNANNATPAAVPIPGEPEPEYRARRIAELLADGAPLSVERVAEMQLDIRSLEADDVLPQLIRTPARSPLAGEALELVRSWDRRMARDSAAALIYAAWLLELGPALWADELGELAPAYGTIARPRVIRRILTTHREWCEDRNTAEAESCEDILSASLEAALAALARRFGDDATAWRWGDAHIAVFRHQVLDRIAILAPYVSPAIETDGGDFTINRGQTGGGTLNDPTASDPSNPFAHVHGAGLRAAYDLADLDNSRFMIAPGQSGHPLSRHYADLLERWRDGRTLRLDGDTSGARELVLSPPQGTVR